MPARVRTLLTFLVVIGLFVSVFLYATRGRPREFVITSDLGPVSLPGGTRLVFFGDSITAGGVLPGGYVHLIREALRSSGSGDVEVTGSGVVGDDAQDLLERLEEDVLRLAPTIVVVYVGVNDVAGVGNGAESAGVDSYRARMTTLVERIQSSGASAVVCTPGLLGETPRDGSRENELLDRYAEVVRALAAERGTGLCDLRAAFKEYLAENNTQNRTEGLLTVDGIHLNPAGNRFVARQMLEALGAFG